MWQKLIFFTKRKTKSFLHASCSQKVQKAPNNLKMKLISKITWYSLVISFTASLSENSRGLRWHKATFTNSCTRLFDGRLFTLQTVRLSEYQRKMQMCLVNLLEKCVDMVYEFCFLVSCFSGKGVIHWVYFRLFFFLVIYQPPFSLKSLSSSFFLWCWWKTEWK